MRVLLLLLPALAGPLTPTPASPHGPTFCAEWIRQSTEGFDRLTLFRDGTLVWKSVRGVKEDVKRQTLTPDEIQFYCAYFERSDFWSSNADFRTGLTSELASESAVTLTRANGSRKTIRFDDFSVATAEASSLRAALEGLRGLFLSPLAPASRFTPASLAPGTLLKRFDGRIFRVRRLETDTGFVEIVGVTEPYSQFVKIEELRFQFAPPESAP